MIATRCLWRSSARRLPGGGGERALTGTVTQPERPRFTLHLLGAMRNDFASEPSLGQLDAYTVKVLVAPPLKRMCRVMSSPRTKVTSSSNNRTLCLRSRSGEFGSRHSRGRFVARRESRPVVDRLESFGRGGAACSVSASKAGRAHAVAANTVSDVLGPLSLLSAFHRKIESLLGAGAYRYVVLGWGLSP